MLEMTPRVNTIGGQVYEIIKLDICNGTYGPGYWLQEKELAAKLQVSRSPVREALRRLVADRLVIEKPNKGIFVREFTKKDIEEIYAMRVLIENYAIEETTKNLTSERENNLIHCLEYMKIAHKSKDLQDYVKWDTRLHNMIITQCNNDTIDEVYQQVSFTVQQFRRYSFKEVERYKESIDEHEGIVMGIINNDASKACEINKKHLMLAKETIIQYLNGQANEFIH